MQEIIGDSSKLYINADKGPYKNDDTWLDLFVITKDDKELINDVLKIETFPKR